MHLPPKRCPGPHAGRVPPAAMGCAAALVPPARSFPRSLYQPTGFPCGSAESPGWCTRIQLLPKHIGLLRGEEFQSDFSNPVLARKPRS